MLKLCLTVDLVQKAGTTTTTSLNKLSSQLCFPLILPSHLKITLIKGCSEKTENSLQF